MDDRKSTERAKPLVIEQSNTINDIANDSVVALATGYVGLLALGPIGAAFGAILGAVGREAVGYALRKRQTTEPAPR